MLAPDLEGLQFERRDNILSTVESGRSSEVKADDPQKDKSGRSGMKADDP